MLEQYVSTVGPILKAFGRPQTRYRVRVGCRSNEISLWDITGRGEWRTDHGLSVADQQRVLDACFQWPHRTPRKVGQQYVNHL